VTITVFSHFPL